MVKKQKHYDNKKDLIREMRLTQMMVNNNISVTWTAYMMIGLLTLFEDLNFRQERINKFIAGFDKRMKQYQQGKLSVPEIEKKLLDSGIIVEKPMM